MGGPGRWAAAFLLGAAVSAAAWRRHALSPTGAAGAAVVGTAIFGAGGPRGSAPLLLFFGSSTLLSRLSGDGAHRGPHRTLVQVLANGGLPAVLSVCASLGPSRRLRAAYGGALAAANADTWATEIGARSKATPRLITSGEAVRRGTSGGVTPLGTLASLAGAMVVGGAHAAIERRPAAVPRLTAAGAAGSLADSVLGATLQAVYICRHCGMRTEDRTHSHQDRWPTLTRVRGLAFMTNDTVNLCASLVGAAVAGVLCDSHE